MSERNCEPVVDVSVPQVVRSQAKTESCSVPWNQFLAVPVPRVIEQFVEVPKFVSQDRTQQRTLTQISDTPVPQVVEELVEGLRSLLPGWGSTAFGGADFRNLSNVTHLEDQCEGRDHARSTRRMLTPLWETLHTNAQSPEKSMNVRSVKVYDDVLSRNMTITTNNKIMKQ